MSTILNNGNESRILSNIMHWSRQDHCVLITMSVFTELFALGPESGPRRGRKSIPSS